MKTVTHIRHGLLFVIPIIAAACGPEMVTAPSTPREPMDFIPIPSGPSTPGDPVMIPTDSGVRDSGIATGGPPAIDASTPDVRSPPPPPTDSGVAPPMMMMPPSGATTCERACQHVYRDCMLGFRSSSGATLTESQCVSACAAGQFGGAESCLATAPCGAASLNACFSSSPPSTPDASTPTDASGGTPPPSSGATALEDEVLALTNARRAAGANCGGTMFGPAPPLRMNETLRAVARAHSTDMGTRNYFAHNSLDGRTPFQRMMAAGYSSSPMGENIAAGNGTAAATVTQWMNSPGHCRNIMNPSYRALGVGYANVPSSMYRHYWTQNFGGM